MKFKKRDDKTFLKATAAKLKLTNQLASKLFSLMSLFVTLYNFNYSRKIVRYFWTDIKEQILCILEINDKAISCNFPNKNDTHVR